MEDRELSLSEKLLINVLQEYGIQQPEITFLRHNENKTFKVIDQINNKYLLKVHQPATENLLGLQHKKEGLQYEMQLLYNISQKSDITVPVPVCNQQGDFITEITLTDKVINCTLTKWIDGRDVQKEDLSNHEFVYGLGNSTAKLHRYFYSYYEVPHHVRPEYGKSKIRIMLEQIYGGVEKRLFSQKDFNIVEQSLLLIASRFESLDRRTSWGIIHGDLNMSNILITGQKGCAFIDFSLFGYGYYLLDVAMAALNSTSEKRSFFLKGYFGNDAISDETMTLLEGFMLMSIFGYYAFHMENKKIHPWITERMPLLCANRCKPFLSGDRIIYDF